MELELAVAFRGYEQGVLKAFLSLPSMNKSQGGSNRKGPKYETKEYVAIGLLYIRNRNSGLG